MRLRISSRSLLKRLLSSSRALRRVGAVALFLKAFFGLGQAGLQRVALAPQLLDGADGFLDALAEPGEDLAFFGGQRQLFGFTLFFHEVSSVSNRWDGMLLRMPRL
jgi:hypothetical protein